MVPNASAFLNGMALTAPTTVAIATVFAMVAMALLRLIVKCVASMPAGTTGFAAVTIRLPVNAAWTDWMANQATMKQAPL
jgi:uncharacterized protein HemY